MPSRITFPGSIAHGEAFRMFLESSRDTRFYDDDARLAAWRFFLKGWLGKAKQQDNFRRRR